MPSLKEIKTRIASVQSTRKITSAMKMVASSKLHHAQVAIQNMLPYENLLEHILKSFLASASEDARSILSTERKELKSVALIVYSSNSSLCGGFNNNVIRMMQQAIDGYKAQGISNITIYPIGRKVAEKVVKLGYKPAGDFIELADKPNAAVCSLQGYSRRADQQIPETRSRQSRAHLPPLQKRRFASTYTTHLPAHRPFNGEHRCLQ